MSSNKFDYPTTLFCEQSNKNLIFVEKCLPTKNCFPAIYREKDGNNEKIFVKFLVRGKENDIFWGKRYNRFIKESEFCRKLSSSNYLEFYGTSFSEQIAWLAMEYGSPIKPDKIATFSEGDRLSFLNSVFASLIIVHSHHICHRDVKLDNIVQRTDGEYILVDFGISYLCDSEDVDLTMAGEKPFYKGAVPLEKQGNVFFKRLRFFTR